LRRRASKKPVGSSIAAGISSNTVAGRTTLRYERIA